MPDGTKVIIRKYRSHLQPDSIPSIFPNLPGYLSKIVKRGNLLLEEYYWLRKQNRTTQEQKKTSTLMT